MTTATREATTRLTSESAPPTTMRAFVMLSVDQVGFTDKPIPLPGPFDAIVKTTRALVCTSDAHTAHGAIGPRNNLTSATKPWASCIKLDPRLRDSLPETG